MEPIKHTVKVHFADGFDGFARAWRALPDDVNGFSIEPLTEWRGYGPSEREEFVGFEVSWETG
jgi:hypothetical protein